MGDDDKVAGAESGRLSPTALHLALTVVAVGSLLISLRPVWTAVTPTVPWLGLAVTFLYVALLALVIAALCIRSDRALVRIDVAVLVIAVLLEAVRFHRVVTGGRYHYGIDEGALSSQALQSLQHGSDPYRPAWPGAVALSPTQLMGGGIVDRFDYPPFGIVLGAVAGFIWHGLATPAFVDGLALVAMAIFGFAVLPSELRPLAVIVVVGLDLDTTRALSGDPVVIALPFLAVAMWRWTSVGSGNGRLGRSGALRAACLGLAAATQQLAWFIVPFVMVGLWRIRRGDMSRRQAGALIAKYVGVSAAVFAVVNVPFAIAGPGLWWRGITDVLTQHAVIFGQGVSMISVDVLHGSGALEFYSYATAAVYAALLIVFAVGVRRLGPAVVVIPTTVFLLSVRSEDSYYLALAPLWIITAFTTPRSDFDLARPLHMPSFLARPRVLRTATVALFLPALVCVVVAVATPRPLTTTVTSRFTDSSHRLNALNVEVRNSSSHVISPHFAVLANARLSVFWHVGRGPAQLAPGEQAAYQLTSPNPLADPESGLRLRLAVVSDHPETISTILLTNVG
jgi:hypothetical protein